MATVAQTIYDALINQGATAIQAAGIMGNMVQESSLDPEDSEASAWGLVQWTTPGAGSGIDRTQYVTGNVTQDIINQVALLKSQGGFAAASGNTAAEAAQNFMNNYERPDVALENAPNRTNSATTIFQVAQSGGWTGLDWGNMEASGTGGVPIAPNAAGTTTGGGAFNTTGVPVGVNGQPLSMADIPAVVQWIDANWASYSWLLKEPGLAAVLEKAAVQGLSTDQVQAEIEQTQWWKTTSAAMRQYEQDRASNPADYNFNAPGSKAAAMYAQVANAAAGYGVGLSAAQIQALALQALEFGWNTQQIEENIGHGATARNAMQVVQQLNAVANQYYQTMSPQAEEQWTQQVAGGTRTMQEFQAAMAQQAAMKWTGYAQQLLNGNTMQQLTDNLRTEAAKTMEVDPSSINFTTDPTYQRIIDYAPPTPAGAKQLPQHRVMTLSEMDQYLKSTPSYGFTQNARDSAAQLETTLTQDFGKIPGATI